MIFAFSTKIHDYNSIKIIQDIYKDISGEEKLLSRDKEIKRKIIALTKNMLILVQRSSFFD